MYLDLNFVFLLLEDGIDENYGVAVQFDEDEEEVNISNFVTL